MAVVTIHPLREALTDIAAVRHARLDRIAAGAKAVLADHTYANGGDAMRTLRASGFTAFEAEALIDDIRQVAMQHVVAMEMAEP